MEQLVLHFGDNNAGAALQKNQYLNFSHYSKLIPSVPYHYQLPS